MDSSSNEKVMELEWLINKLKLSISHTQDCWHFKSKDQKGADLVSRDKLSQNQLS